MPLVVYIGKSSAFYNGRGYLPGEVFMAPDVTRIKRKGKVVEIPFKLSDDSKLRLATDAEAAEFQEEVPTVAQKTMLGKLARKPQMRKREPVPV